MALFRAGSDEAFRVIHDRYRKRLLAYARQMLGGSGQDAEDALQDVFERAYCGLRASDRDLVLKAWLYRVAHNRCIDQLRRLGPFATTAPEEAESRQPSPIALAEQRETLRRLILDVQRLPDQQRSALLMREMSGMSYAELAVTLDVSVPAVKSLLVRARMGLLAASEARDTACSAIREELVVCHDRGVRPSSMARRHLRDCQQCRTFRRSVRGVSRSLTAIAPAVGPVGILIRLLTGGGAAGPGSMLGSSGVTAGGAGAGGAAAGGAAAGGAAAGGGVVVSTGVVAGGVMAGTAGHVATLLAAAIVTAGGAVAVQQAGTPTKSRTYVRPSHHLVAAPLPYSGGAGIAGPAVASQMSQSASQAARTRDASGSALTGKAGRSTKSGSSRLRRSTTGSAAARSTASSSPAGPSSTAPSSATGSGLSASGASSQSSSTAGPATSGPSSTGATSSGTTGTTSGTESSGGAAITSGGATGERRQHHKRIH